MERLADRYDVSLVGHRGVMQDLVFKILAEQVSIGRSPANDIVLDDPTVSGQHARISFDGVGFDLMDLGSKMGVRVNGRPIQSCEIQDGDQIRIGKTIFIFSAQAKDGHQENLDTGLMSSGAELDGAARARLAIYGIVIFVMLILLLVVAGGGSKDEDPSANRNDGAEAELGVLAIEQFDVPSHLASEAQIRESSIRLQRGINAMDAGNLLEAISEFKESLMQNPDCSACRAQVDWAFKRLRNKIAYHFESGRDDYLNLRYQEAIRQLELVLKLAGKEDEISQKAQNLIESAKQKQAEFDRRAIGLPG